MSRSRLLVLGGGGHARSLVDSIGSMGLYEVAGFVGPNPHDSYRDWNTIGRDEDLPNLRSQGITHAVVGVGFLGGNCDGRRNLFELLIRAGYEVPAIVDSSAVLAADATLGRGVFVGKRAVVNSGAAVDDCAIVNTAAVVEHDCCIGSFAHVSVAATLCGGVRVGTGAMVGANAVIIQGVSIGEGAIVGAGSVVLHDVPSGAKVMGVFNGK